MASLVFFQKNKSSYDSNGMIAAANVDFDVLNVLQHVTGHLPCQFLASNRKGEHRTLEAMLVHLMGDL